MTLILDEIRAVLEGPWSSASHHRPPDRVVKIRKLMPPPMRQQKFYRDLDLMRPFITTGSGTLFFIRMMTQF